MNTHIFDYHGVKVHVKILQGNVCINPKDTLKCLGFKDVDKLSDHEEMYKKLVSMHGTQKGLAFAHWVQKVVIPTMETV